MHNDHRVNGLGRGSDRPAKPAQGVAGASGGRGSPGWGFARPPGEPVPPLRRIVRIPGQHTPPHGEVIRTDSRFLARTHPDTAVLVAHGFKGFKDWGFFPLLCERLAAAGHVVVSFNGSRNGIGESLLDFTDLEAFGRNTISHETSDLHWMLDRVIQGQWHGGRPPRAVGLLGHSRGGGTAVIAASERNDVASLVTWAAVSTFERWTSEQEEEWLRTGVTYVANARTGQDMPLRRVVRDDLYANRSRFNVVGAAAKVGVPWLVVQGSGDPTVAAVEARALARAGQATELVMIEGAGHTFEAVHPLEATTPELEAAIAATVRHFGKTLSDPSADR